MAHLNTPAASNNYLNQFEAPSTGVLPVYPNIGTNNAFETPVAEMRLPELLTKNCFVHELHEQFITISESLARASKTISILHEETIELKAEVFRLRLGENSEASKNVLYVQTHLLI
jgi:hypothetical protein